MTDDQPISRLGAHTFLARVATQTVGLISSILIARALGPEGRGRYFLPVTIAIVTQVLGLAGTTPAQLRLWARKVASPSAFVTANLLLTLGLSAISIALLWTVFIAGGSALFPGLRVMDLAIVTFAIPFLIHTPRSSNLLVFNGELRAANFALVAGSLVHAIGALALFIGDALTVEGVLVLYVLGAVTQTVIMMARLRRVGRVRRPWPWSLVKEHLKLGIRLGPSDIFNHLNLRIDVFFVARYRALDGVGLYSIAVTVAELVWLATESVQTSIVRRQVNAPKNEAVEVTFRAVRMNLVLAVSIGFALGVAAEFAIPFVYGTAFEPSTGVVWALLPAVTFMAARRPISNVLVRFARPWVPPVIALVSLICNVGANALLVPRFGIFGAAIASTISYGVGAIIFGLALGRLHPYGPSQLLPGWKEVEAIRNLVWSGLRASKGALTRR